MLARVGRNPCLGKRVDPRRSAVLRHAIGILLRSDRPLGSTRSSLTKWSSLLRDNHKEHEIVSFVVKKQTFRLRPPFPIEQRLFSFGAPPIAADATGHRDHPVTRDQDRDFVYCTRMTHRAHGTRPANGRRD